MLESLSAFWAEYGDLLLEGTRDTLIMIGVSTVFAYLIGLPLGVLLSISQPHGIWPHKVDAGVVEAAQSMGASRLQIVWKVYLPEAVPSLILGASISIITLLGYTAIAGAVGAGGLGDLAIRYGYQRSVPSMMLATVVLIIVLVQIIQSLFSWLSTKMDKRLR